MSESLLVRALEGRVHSTATDGMSVEVRVQAKTDARGGTAELSVRITHANSSEKSHFTGNVAVALRTETDGEWTEKALIQHVWPTASTILNEHARRLGVRNLHLPFSAPENASFNVQ